MNILVAIHSPFAMWTIPASYVEALRREFPAHVFRHAANAEEALDAIVDTEVAFSSQVDPGQLAVAPRLRWIHSSATGVGSMLFPEMVASPVMITNSRGLSADTMAEHVLAVTLALFRRLPLAFQRQMAREWAQDEISGPPGNRTIEGSRVLLVGLGSIGSAVARRMTALGARVIAVRRSPDKPAPDAVDEVTTPERLVHVLPHADVVVLAAPQTAGTRGLIGEAEIAAMDSRAILVNVSRGKLVDEDALAAALAQGRIAGAALDVFAHEPLAPDSPLWTLPNVLITPHTSGFRPDHWDVVTALFAENLRRYDAGAPLLNVVDKTAGY